MIRKVFASSVLILGFVLVCFAADITGNWNGKIETGNGELPINYTFKVEGEKLTGTLKVDNNDVTVNEGKVAGDDITFKVTIGDRVIPHVGKIVGETIKLKIHYDDQIFESTLARSK
jgi:hypothetical protein